MENDSQNPLTASPEENIPSQSRWSTILNGVGNGAMIGAVPLAFDTFCHGVFGKSPVPKSWHKPTIVLTACGVGVGAFFGMVEAKHVDAHRIGVSKRIDHTNSKITELSQRIEALEAQREAPASATR